MRFRSKKACGSFDCAKRGSFELLVHMEADPACCTYAEVDFKVFLPAPIASELDDIAAYRLRHRSGAFVVGAVPPTADRSAAFRYWWKELDTALARQGIWLLSATPKQLRREPRWSNSLQIAQAAQTDIDPSDHERVVAHLSTVGPARIRDCLRLCGAGVDSFDALLALVSSGVLFLNPPHDLSLDGELRLDPPPFCDSSTVSWLPSPHVDRHYRG